MHTVSVVPKCQTFFYVIALCFTLRILRELPGGLVVRILCIRCCGLGSVPGWGTEIR